MGGYSGLRFIRFQLSLLPRPLTSRLRRHLSDASYQSQFSMLVFVSEEEVLLILNINWPSYITTFVFYKGHEKTERITQADLLKSVACWITAGLLI